MSVTNSFVHNKKKMDVPQPENEKQQPKSCKKKKKSSPMGGVALRKSGRPRETQNRTLTK